MRLTELTVGMIAVVASLAVGCSGGIPDISEWKTHRTSDGKMAVKFPEKPTIEKQTRNTAAGDINMKIAVLEVTSNLVFTANSIAVPVDPENYDVARGLQGEVDARRSSKSEVISDVEISKDGVAGREIITRESEDTFVRVRIYIDGSGPTIFQATVVGASRSSVESKASSEFLDSIEFIN